jgi:hypothetical protein
MSTDQMYKAPRSDSPRTTTSPALMEKLGSVQALAEGFSLPAASTTQGRRPMSAERRAELIERLARRSVRADGFDRAALADARRAWD